MKIIFDSEEQKDMTLQVLALGCPSDIRLKENHGCIAGESKAVMCKQCWLAAGIEMEVKDAINEEINNTTNEIQFNISVTMNKRWVDHFCSMLNYMQQCGNIGHSSMVGFFADGDGDFRPKFEFDIAYDTIPEQNNGADNKRVLDVVFDAG